ncbi:MAG: glycoside hydrolase family 88 protein [Lachnospiraceae bacterium]|nr:glycoside hydrolase family 88 protein [Lachnospiraceae bacterium]
MITQDDTVNNVINAMLAMQRYPWEQGVCAQALYEAGKDELWIPMAFDAVKRMDILGRLAMVGGGDTVSDPAANGEVCLRAYQKTGDRFFLNGAEKMLDYLMNKAPRTEDRVICHNDVSFFEGYSKFQLWIDGLYMVPPFLAVMGEIDEAFRQLKGYVKHLFDEEQGLFFHIKDVRQGKFVRKVFWATGNGWALMGIARLMQEAQRLNREDMFIYLNRLFINLLDAMKKYSLPDGRFRDILDKEDSFIDGTSSMMYASSVYRGVYKGFISRDYLKFADLAYESVKRDIDPFGIVRHVAGCPDFVSEGTSAEAQAAFIMANAWKKAAIDHKLEEKDS